jgi:hypothetical protein
MKYRGFNEAPLVEAVRDLEAHGLSLTQIHPLINVAGAKWRAIQIRESRFDEIQDAWDNTIFHQATITLMQATMKENQKLAKLGHAKEFDRFILLAMGFAFAELVASGPPTIVNWLKDGDTERRKIVLAFATGSYIMVDPDALDAMIHRIVHARFDDPEITSYVIATIHRLGNAGYACLNPVPDTLS